MNVHLFFFFFFFFFFFRFLVTELFRHSVDQYADLPCMGTRYVERTRTDTIEIQVEGKTITKEVQHPFCTEYKWATYKQIANEALRFGCGLERIGMKSGDHIGFYASTW